MNANGTGGISKQTLRRLPLYLNCLKSRLQSGHVTVSSNDIATLLGLNQVQVRKDLASVSSGGKPKVGYVTQELISDIENFLGYNNVDSAILVGVGQLGRALLSYSGFSKCGVEIVAAFDSSEQVVDRIVSGKRILPLEKLINLCDRMQIHIGIITVPEDSAQEVCDWMIRGGIKAIWNFAPVHLKVPKDVIVQNENLAANLAVLSRQYAESLK